MPNTPARLTLALSAQSGNILQFGADQGLLSPDQLGATGAADGPAALYTIPNHISAVADRWWRPYTHTMNANSFSANVSVVQPVILARSAVLQAVAVCTPNTNGAGNNVVVSLYQWNGEGLKFNRLTTTYIPAYPAGTTVSYAYFPSYYVLEAAKPYLLVSGSSTIYYCWARQALPPIFPYKSAQPTDASVGPGMLHSANANYLPDTSAMATIDLDGTTPSWALTSFIPYMYLRLGAAS